MTAVSGDNAEAIAGKGMTQALTRPEQKTVCASVLRQAEQKVSVTAVKRHINKLHRDIQNQSVPSALQEALLAQLKKVVTAVFPPKPNA